MNIARLSERIEIQKQEVKVDKLKNHKNEWIRYFNCYATVSSDSNRETETASAGQTVDHDRLSFTVRYCSYTKDLDSTHYRILFRGEVYGIESVDFLNYRHNAVKLRCRKERA